MSLADDGGRISRCRKWTFRYPHERTVETTRAWPACTSLPILPLSGVFNQDLWVKKVGADDFLRQLSP